MPCPYKYGGQVAALASACGPARKGPRPGQKPMAEAGKDADLGLTRPQSLTPVANPAYEQLPAGFGKIPRLFGLTNLPQRSMMFKVGRLSCR